MDVDPGIATAGIKLVMDLLKTAAEKLQKPKPDVPGALALISQTQQHLDQLRSENFDLQRAFIQSASENLELKRQSDKRQDWNELKATFEQCQTMNKSWVYRRRGVPNQFACPNCIAEERVTFLQDGYGGEGTHLYCNRCRFLF